MKALVQQLDLSIITFGLEQVSKSTFSFQPAADPGSAAAVWDYKSEQPVACYCLGGIINCGKSPYLVGDHQCCGYCRCRLLSPSSFNSQYRREYLVV